MYTTLNVTVAKLCTNNKLLLAGIVLILLGAVSFHFKVFIEAGIYATIGLILSLVALQALSKRTRNIIQTMLIGVFPERRIGLWYAGAWYTNRSRLPLLAVNNVFVFDPLKVKLLNDNDDHLVMGLIPAFVIGKNVGLYKVTRHYRDTKRSNSDNAGWDNGMLVDLELMAIYDRLDAIALMNANAQLTETLKRINSQ